MHAILGQPKALSVLRSQLATGRVHHAQLFHGPAGVGKFTTALALAKTLLCHDPQTDNENTPLACGDCESCRLFNAPKPAAESGPAKKGKGKAARDDDGDDEDDDAGEASPDGGASAHPMSFSHPDLHIVVKELAAFSDDANVRKRKLTQIPVEIVREHLLAPAHHSAAMGHGKVLIVDEAELLNAAGQNAILKTLEEPPPRTVFILVAAREDRLLPTIRSRCQRVAFGLLPEAEVEAMLLKKSPLLDAKKAKWLAIFSQGSPGRADLGLAYGLHEWGESILPPLRDIAARKARPEWGSLIATRIESFASEWVARHKNASKEAANRQGADLMLSMLSHFAARRLQESSRACDPADLGGGETRCAPWLRAIEAVREAETRLAQNANLALVCDGLSSAVHSACGV